MEEMRVIYQCVLYTVNYVNLTIE